MEAQYLSLLIFTKSILKWWTDFFSSLSPFFYPSSLCSTDFVAFLVHVLLNIKPHCSVCLFYLFFKPINVFKIIEYCMLFKLFIYLFILYISLSFDWLLQLELPKFPFLFIFFSWVI